MTLGSPETVGGRAQLLIDTRRYSDALGVLGEALSLEPANARLRCLLSLTLFKLRRYDEAVLAARDAIARQPEDEWAYRLLALALIDKSKAARAGRRRLASEAAQAAREAVRLAPRAMQAQVVLAQS